LKKEYYIVMLVVAIAISSIIAYYFSMPRTQTFKIEIDYSPLFESALVQSKNEWYVRGSVMHIIDYPHQRSIQLRRNDSVLLKLSDYPPNVTEEWNLIYNYVFLNDVGGVGDVTCEQIWPGEPMRFTVPKDGYYVFELGVPIADAYYPGDSIGNWTFIVTVIPP
jgi:hypothetical protein